MKTVTIRLSDWDLYSIRAYQGKAGYGPHDAHRMLKLCKRLEKAALAHKTKILRSRKGDVRFKHLKRCAL
jgi:hypothetical protein